ncbi:MAG: InlB B-repeat-containing protein [Clostridiaceae bacterium]|jgi:uncharacterized repeat protein (TIGR02543 family)|nr:InlB B-repeat-containing protein [Clostridiaceae bacterium]
MKSSSKFSRLIPVVILMLLSIIALSACTKKTYYAQFYVDDALYASVELKESFALPAEPTKDGFAFDGWFTDKDTLIAAFDIHNVDLKKPSANIQAYAKWRAVEADTLTINFYVDGAVFATKTAKNAAEFTLPTAPEKAGFAFLGWYVDETYTTAFQISGVTVFAGEIQVYAKLRAIDPERDLTIKFTVDGAVYATRTVRHAAELTLPDAPTKDGSLFLGWYTDTAGTTAFSIADVTDFSGETSVYAKWGAATNADVIVTAAIIAAEAQYTGYNLTASDSRNTQTALINRTNGSIDNMYFIAKEEHTEPQGYDSRRYWIIDGVVYFAYNDTTKSDQDLYQKLTAPKNADGTLNALYLDEYVNGNITTLSTLPPIVNNVIAVGGGKYTMSRNGTAFEFTVENGRLTKLTTPVNGISLELKYDGGQYALPARPEVTWERLYTVTVVLQDGSLQYLLGVTELSANDINIEVADDSVLEGVFKDAAFTDELTGTLNLTADLTLYAKVVAYTGDTGVVKHALGESFKRDGYILKNTNSSGDTFITVATVPNTSRPYEITVLAYYSNESDSESWSNGTVTWLKNSNGYRLYGYSFFNTLYDAIYYYIKDITQFTLKEGTTNIYIGNSEYNGAIEVTVADGLITKVVVGNYLYEISYDVTANSGIPTKPNVVWTPFYFVQIYTVINGEMAYYNRVDLSALNYAEALTMLPDVYKTVQFFLDEACTQPAVFPLTLTADIDLYAKCTAAAEGDKIAVNLVWSGNYNTVVSVGDTFPPSDLTVIYSDSSEETITLPSASVEIIGFDSTAPGTITVYFVYQTRAVGYTVTVSD